MYNTPAEAKAIQDAKVFLKSTDARYFSELSNFEKEYLVSIFFKADKGYESLGADNVMYNRLFESVSRMLDRPTQENRLTVTQVLIDMLTTHYENMVDEILADMRDATFKEEFDNLS